MDPIRIVIVEDEMLVRQGIKSYIEGAGENMEVAGTFANARDAVAFLRSNSVQILITDINMAQMSGLDLIRHCVRCLYPMGIIVLSCHDSFEYARQAFALGADAYLLKDEVTQPQLIAEIKKSYARHRAACAAPGQAAAFAAQEAAVAPSQPCVAARIGFRSKYEQFVPLPMQADGKVVFDVAAEIVRAHAAGQLLYRNGDMLLCIPPQGGVQPLREKITLLAKQLHANLLNYFNQRVYLSVSGLGAAQDLDAALHQAADAAYLAFYDTEGILFFYADRRAAAAETCTAFYARRIELASPQWQARFQTDLEAYFAWARQAVLLPPKLLKNMHGFLYELENHLLAYYGVALSALNPCAGVPDRDILEGLDHCDLVRDYVLFIVDQAARYVNSRKSGDASLQRIIEYIDNHYAEPITLALLADTFHINAGYLCKLFKDSKHTSFISYLNQVRIARVKQLLKGPRLSLEEIADQTGFSNANYLVRVFKRTTGQTIGEYRKH